jgi:hypothetical protein
LIWVLWTKAMAPMTTASSSPNPIRLAALSAVLKESVVVRW